MFYIVTKIILLIMAFGVSVYAMVVTGMSLKDSGITPLAISIFVILGFFSLVTVSFGIFVSMLCYSHIGFVLFNQTTNEFLKTVDDNDVNPFRK